MGKVLRILMLILASFKQHSLRNPIVEQVITETLRVVRDIWKRVGRIDEIHIELGREVKNPADKRKKNDCADFGKVRMPICV